MHEGDPSSALPERVNGWCQFWRMNRSDPKADLLRYLQTGRFRTPPRNHSLRAHLRQRADRTFIQPWTQALGISQLRDIHPGKIAPGRLAPMAQW